MSTGPLWTDWAIQRACGLADHPAVIAGAVSLRGESTRRSPQPCGCIHQSMVEHKADQAVAMCHGVGQMLRSAPPPHAAPRELAS